MATHKLKMQNTSTALDPLYGQEPAANPVASYESLPPNFSLSANMLAGAFAGIAVCRRWRAIGRCIR